MNRTKNPISYIFRIIRHIVDKCGIQNNADCIIKAWGKCVGQKLRGEEILEFNLLVSNEVVISELINILTITDILHVTTEHIPNININNNNNNNNNESEIKYIDFFLNNKIIKLQIYSSLKYFTNHNYNYNYYTKQAEPDIDFTCDNLCIDLKGNISTIIPSNNPHFDNLNWISRSINDALYKNFSIISITDHSNLQTIIELNIKYKEMLRLGFKYIYEPLMSTNDIILKSHTDIVHFSDRIASCACVICHENYENHENHENVKNTVLLRCLHDFHIDCLHNWIKKKNKTCPMCRVEIDFRPHTKYGDHTIDNIIENYEPTYYITGNVMGNTAQYG